MKKLAGNLEGTDGFQAYGIQQVTVVFDKPVAVEICLHINLGIVQCGNLREKDRRTICLRSDPLQEIIQILFKGIHRNLRIRFMSDEINRSDGHKSYLFMLVKDFEQPLLGMLLFRYGINQVLSHGFHPFGFVAKILLFIFIFRQWLFKMGIGPDINLYSIFRFVRIGLDL